ncbi:Indole-3-acetic acid-induced protein ARG7 [Apostasia shenzhenica]|uniref:Indole-3-acetic acid-induced protein ARG7 n=1 Tax=Apostasia shenzhenica TaxID=1088818 RepID=A0A2I0A439_9ASPA|nr:Indole-3-acetic acid-induced protein ARG7 [Apostasia shenzhenica]
MKSSRIRHIGRLRQMMVKWRTRARGLLEAAARGSPDVVPAGHVAVCVGSSNRRFVIRVAHLNHPAFRNLLFLAEDEHGFSHPGLITLPCDEFLFIQILRQMSPSCAFDDAFDEPAGGCFSCCRAGGGSSRNAEALPLLW